MSEQGEGVAFLEEEGGGVFVVAEGEGSAGYDLATLVNGDLRLGLQIRKCKLYDLTFRPY